MTIQDLKDNRDSIIATITEQVGEENVKAVMAEMVKGLSCCDSIEELIENAIYMATEFEVRIEKVSRLNQLRANAAEREEENGNVWHPIYKRYVKNIGLNPSMQKNPIFA